MSMRAIAPVLAGLATACSLRAQVERVGSPRPFPFGVTETVRSKDLGEYREINIHLPHAYALDTAARFPVIYLLDGSADEDFVHVAGASQFAAFPWVDWMPSSIVVGIANVDRKRDLTFPTTIAKDKADFPTTGGSAAFMRFIGDELVPFIDSAYRTNKDRMLIGQSLGGLFATEVLFTRPSMFNRYLIVSPSLWWDNESLLARPPAFASAKPASVFVAYGKEGKVMEGDARRLAALLRSKGVPTGSVRLKALDHATIMHQAVMDGFRWMSFERAGR
jgi:hypothetical protein